MSSWARTVSFAESGQPGKPGGVPPWIASVNQTSRVGGATLRLRERFCGFYRPCRFAVRPGIFSHGILSQENVFRPEDIESRNSAISRRRSYLLVFWQLRVASLLLQCAEDGESGAYTSHACGALLADLRTLAGSPGGGASNFPSGSAGLNAKCARFDMDAGICEAFDNIRDMRARWHSWEIVSPDARKPDHLYTGENALTEPLNAITGQIETAIAPLRAAGKIDKEPISFAILTLP